MMNQEFQKIRVEMVCDCGNVCVDVGENKINGAIVLHDYITYICNQCGKSMTCKIIEITETEL